MSHDNLAAQCSNTLPHAPHTWVDPLAALVADCRGYTDDDADDRP